MKFNKFVRQRYPRLLIRQLSLQRARFHLRDLAREFLQMTAGRQQRPRAEALPVRQYQAPKLTRLTPEQAKLKLFGQLSVGDQGAKELLDVLFAEPVSCGSDPRS